MKNLYWIMPHLAHWVIIASALLLALAPVSAQDPGTLRKAHELARQADRIAAGGILGFEEAQRLYEEAVTLAPEDGELRLKAGVNQLNGPQRHLALQHIEEAARLGFEPSRVHYLLGYARQLNAFWEEAIVAYEVHQRGHVPRPDQPTMYSTAPKQIAECRHGLRLSGAPSSATVKHAGTTLNSSYADYGALPSATGDTLWFTSRRPVGTAKVNKTTGEYFENVHLAIQRNGTWTDPVAEAGPLNSAGNDASVGLTPQGGMFIYRDDKGHGDIFRCDRTAGGWQEPVRLGPNVNTRGNESSAWITGDGTWLYFVSDRPDDNVGGQDIYRCPWDERTKDWGPARNLGPDVNSTYDEDGVFVAPDGNTLYFSSKGHDSMGGYDIFRSRVVDGRWTKAENLGRPVNSPDDDLFFVLSADGATGWFSSVRPGGQGEDDIYLVAFPAGY